MRIIAGQYRGRRLLAPPGLRLRPTSDALRETLFNILGAEAAGAVFVDACAGTGAVGLEALSRGAAEAIFIEPASAALAALRANLARLPPPVAARVLPRRAPAAFARLGRPVDVVFLDPPYAARDVYAQCLDWLGGATSDIAWAAGGAQVIAEHARRHDLAAAYGRLRRGRVLVQGDSQLSFYRLA